MSLGFLGKKLHTHNLSYTHRLDYAHAGLFLYAQTIAQNPDFFFVLLLLSHVVCLASFPCFYASKVYVSHVCLLFYYHMLE